MELTDKIKTFLNESGQFIKRNKNTLGLGAAMMFSPIIGSNNAQAQIQTKPRIPLEQTMKVAGFFEEEQTDSLLNILEKDLYSQSGNLYTLSENPNIREVDGVKVVDLMQVGVNYWTDGKIEGRFKDEHQRSQSTTWATYANMSGMSEQELKKSINLTSGIPTKDMLVLYGRDGKYSTVVYTGREDLGVILRDREGVGQQSTIRNHINKQRGKPFTVPAYSAFNAMGYDFSVPEIVQKYDIIEEQKKLLEEKLNDVELEKDSLQKEYAQTIQEKDSITEEKDSLQNEIRKWNVSLMGGLNAYGHEKTNKAILTPEIGLYATLNNVGIGGKYSFPVNRELRVDMEESRPPIDPNRPNPIQHVRQTTTKHSMEKHAIQGILGYKLNDVFTPFITAGIERGQDITKTQDYFFQEAPGPNNTVHIINEHMDGTHTNIDEYTSPIIGGGTFINIPNTRLGLHIDAAYSTKSGISGSVGIKYDLRKPQNNNQNNNGGN